MRFFLVPFVLLVVPSPVTFRQRFSFYLRNDRNRRRTYAGRQERGCFQAWNLVRPPPSGALRLLFADDRQPQRRGGSRPGRLLPDPEVPGHVSGRKPIQ